MQSRQSLIDALKVLGSQLIVLHHFSAYGPVADALSVAFPTLSAWLFDYARMAVQVFLVLGGYLAVQSLVPVSGASGSAKRLPAVLLQRYLRLAAPLVLALLLAAACAALAHRWLNADFIPAPPQWGQALAHMFLLNGVLHMDSLSAGVWYVAIDFQLYLALALLLWLGYKASAVLRLTRLLVIALTLASLFYFNRQPTLDNWALYFFGAYGLGACAYWAGQSPRTAWYLALISLAGGSALVLDFRERILVAWLVALLLCLAHWRQKSIREPSRAKSFIKQSLHLLAQSSYALFLLHFPVLMLGNALFNKLGGHSPQAGVVMLVVCYLASIALAMLFERKVEAPLARLSRLTSPPKAARAP